MGNNDQVKFALFGAGTRGEMDLGYYFDKLKKHIRYWAVAEPDPQKRNLFVQRFNIPKENAFSDWRELLDKPKLADAVLNALPCRMHHDSTIAALKAGYDVLLEKPMSHTPGECVNLVQAAKKYRRKLAIVFENRYNKIYLRLKGLLKKGLIGQMMNVVCDESIGYWHFISSYVRGLHSRAEEGNSFMIAKGIHDTDLVTWFVNSKSKKVSSFGSLSFFNEKNAPEGAPKRCTDGCPVQKDCIFDAVKQYYKPGRMKVPLTLLKGQSLKQFIDIIKEPRFRTLGSLIVRDLNKPNILKALEEGDHGKCVFYSHNGVVDHQTTSIEYENEVTCSFSLSAFSSVWERSCELRGTEGEILSRDWSGKLELRTFNPARVRRMRIPYHGLHHGGGDPHLLLDFARAIKSDDPNEVSMTNVENCLESHLIALAAEEARLKNKVVEMEDFRKRAYEEARVIAKREI